MNHILGTVTLHSQDKNRMLDFFSDVLEFDVDQETDSVINGNFIFQLTENITVQNQSIEFNFRVKSEEELQEVLRKYHFFLYRKPATNTLKEKISLNNQQNKKILTIEDIDHRLWHFELPHKNIDL